MLSDPKQHAAEKIFFENFKLLNNNNVDKTSDKNN